MGEHKINPKALAAKMGMLPSKRLEPANVPVNVNIGHDGRQVVVQYSQKLLFITYTPDQARAHIEQLQSALDHLEHHLAQENLKQPGDEVTPADITREAGIVQIGPMPDTGEYP